MPYICAALAQNAAHHPGEAVAAAEAAAEAAERAGGKVVNAVANSVQHESGQQLRTIIHAMVAVAGRD